MRYIIMRVFLFIIISTGISQYAVAETIAERDLTIESVGAWATGNSIFYIKVDRFVGPENCRSKVIKVYLGGDENNSSQLAAKNLIRSLALTALTANLKVSVFMPEDQCLHNNPTLSSIWLTRSA